MNKIFSCLMIGSLAVAVASCKDESWHNGDPVAGTPTGELALSSLTVEVDAQSTSVAKAPASRAEVDASGFIVKLSDSEGELVNQWTYSAMPEILTLPVGDYTVDVASGIVEKAAWEAPYYAGTVKAAITEGQIADLGTVVCRLANVKVSVVYDDDLRSRLGSDAQVTVLVNDDGSLIYGLDETRAGYFEYITGSNTLVASFHATVKGTVVTGRKALTDIKAGHHYILTFKAKNFDSSIPDETGTIDISDDGSGIALDLDVTDVDVDGSVTVDEDVFGDSDRPGGEGDDPNPPTDDISFDAQDLDFDNPNTISDDMDGRVYITSKNPMTHLRVKISSDNEQFMLSVSDLLPTEFDLADPGEYEENFSGLGFPVGDQIVGQTSAVFDITQFLGLLNAFPGTHTFTLTVEDNAGGSLTKNLVLIAVEHS